jgi:N-acyl-D-aspartate/D-glutamate deacylase
MRSGALGFSSFGDPSPSHFAGIDELVELAKVVRKYGGFYVPHTRGIQFQWPTNDPELVAYELYLGPPDFISAGTYLGYVQALEVSRRANIPVHIVHLSTAFRIHQPHPDYLDEAAAKATLELIDRARNEGLDVTFDVIVYAGSISAPEKLVDAFYSERVGGLSWVREIGKDEFVERLKTKEFRGRVRKIHDSCRLKFGMVHTKVDPFWFDCFKIVKSENPDYAEKTIGEIAALKKTDPLETLFDLLVEDPKIVWIQFLDRRGTETINSVFIRHPAAMPCTDIAAESAKPEKPETVAPITYSVYPNYFGNYVRDKRVMSLEEAVKKATSFPAQRFGLKDRGVLKPGAFADILIFDIDRIKANATPLNPTQAPDGIEYVLVNGKIVYKEKAHTGEKSGKVLRHS